LSIKIRSKLIELNKNRIWRAKAKNNKEISFLAISLISACEGDTDAESLRLAAIKQPMKTRYEKTDARENIEASMFTLIS